MICRLVIFVDTRSTWPRHGSGQRSPARRKIQLTRLALPVNNQNAWINHIRLQQVQPRCCMTDSSEVKQQVWEAS
jgi:hypothetical protein